jgi:UDP-N-acetylglucosamine 4-epimerase
MTKGIYHTKPLQNFSFLITGGAGFIGSNIVEYLLTHGAGKVRVLDNFATGKKENIQSFFSHPAFEFIEGDIRNLEHCRLAVKDMTYVSHQAALGSVPRSINDPITSTDVNISGFLNMLVAARDEKVTRFVYAASSSTYGDSESLPKVEDVIGKPLSPYAITKYVNELYADVFFKTYGFDSVGMRYFNVFGRRQDPNGAYAAVIPKFVMQFMKYESPVINGDGTNSRDFTYIDNVIQMNLLTMLTDDRTALNTIYNTACGDRTNLKELAHHIKSILVTYDPKIEEVPIVFGPNRAGDIPHSLASIEKAKTKLGYNPEFTLYPGLEEAIQWYWGNLK